MFKKMSGDNVQVRRNPFELARARLQLSRIELARKLNTSPYALARWERGLLEPSTDVLRRLADLCPAVKDQQLEQSDPAHPPISFASTGMKGRFTNAPSLFRNIDLAALEQPRDSIVNALTSSDRLWNNGITSLRAVLDRRHEPAATRGTPVEQAISAGKNTYTYDAHTYHTKVPPQGIATIVSEYLPNGGLVLDPFCGSGMTGVATRYLGYDAILNDLSPAASFISYNFVARVDPVAYRAALFHILERLEDLEQTLYGTTCRECGSSVVQLYTVWSYIVDCSHCSRPFVLWEHCRRYGNTVREHKILRKFPCPNCRREVTKSLLKRRNSLPVFLGYRCCSSRIQEHPLDEPDRQRIERAGGLVDEYTGHFPKTAIPDGINLNQPKRHGYDTIDKLYTPRNLVACAAIWKEIGRIKDVELASSLAFAFTSMYRRVTRLSEYRFWGGSGNTANFNVPHIFNESNVFTTYRRKAKSIYDHLVTTARSYTGDVIVRTGSASDLSFLPDGSVDFIFTDPPFGGNINYSEMNILWESWLGTFTDPTAEAIVNKYQGKDIDAYRSIMLSCLREAHRVLRDGHWMVLLFMNSSQAIWRALKESVERAGFSIDRVSIFDKQHGTFKHFVSANTAGADLMLHCRKTEVAERTSEFKAADRQDVERFLMMERKSLPVLPFIHVNRKSEIDYRTLYSRYIAGAMQDEGEVVDFAEFRAVAVETLSEM